MCEEIEFEIQEEDIPLTMDLEDDVYLVEPKTESLEVTPTKETQYFESETGIYYDNVTVNPIPDEYIIPNLGTKTITKNGTYNATDDNLDGYSKVEVATSGVDINDYFETNSTQVSSYENVGVWYLLVKKLPSINHTGSSKYYLFSRFQGEELDTLNFTFPSGTTLDHMCDGCTKLKKINMSNMISENINSSSGLLYSCSKLETIIFPDDIGTKFGSTNINGMFRGCSSLTTLPLINASNVVDIRYLFRDSNKIANLGGFRNLGEAYLTTQSANYFNYKLDLSPCSLLTEQSIINVLNNLYDIASKGCNTQSIVLGSTNLAKLTEEEIAIATNKGWTIS